MTTTTRIIAAAALAAASIAAPKLASIDFSKLASLGQSAPAGQVVIDQAVQLREVCALVAIDLPDLEVIDSTNDVVDYLNAVFAKSFRGTTIDMPTAQKIGEITSKIETAIGFANESKPVTQAERVLAAGICEMYSHPGPDGK